jgi:hypothetical protein
MWADGGAFAAGVADPSELYELLEDWSRSWGARGLLVFEKFTITAQTGKLSPQPEPLELTGVGKFLAHKNRNVFTLQTPGDAKRFADDAKLRKIGWYTRGRGGEDHGRDATRHLVLALAKLRLITIPTGGAE